MTLAVEALEAFKVADKRLVEDWNSTWGSGWAGSPPLETQVAFLRNRLLVTTSALAIIAEAIIKESTASGASAEGQP